MIIFDVGTPGRRQWTALTLCGIRQQKKPPAKGSTKHGRRIPLVGSRTTLRDCGVAPILANRIVLNLMYNGFDDSKQNALFALYGNVGFGVFAPAAGHSIRRFGRYSIVGRASPIFGVLPFTIKIQAVQDFKSLFPKLFEVCSLSQRKARLFVRFFAF